MEGNMPRKNVESFQGNAQYGDRNKGLVDWKVVFAGERERYAASAALKGVPTHRKRPRPGEVDVEALETAAKEWADDADNRKKKAAEEKAAKAEAEAEAEAPPPPSQ